MTRLAITSISCAQCASWSARRAAVRVSCSKHIDPYRLKVQLEAAQRTLTARAVGSDSYVRQPRLHQFRRTRTPPSNTTQRGSGTGSGKAKYMSSGWDRKLQRGRTLALANGASCGTQSLRSFDGV